MIRRKPKPENYLGWPYLLSYFSLLLGAVVGFVSKLPVEFLFARLCFLSSSVFFVVKAAGPLVPRKRRIIRARPKPPSSYRLHLLVNAIASSSSKSLHIGKAKTPSPPQSPPTVKARTSSTSKTAPVNKPKPSLYYKSPFSISEKIIRGFLALCIVAAFIDSWVWIGSRTTHSFIVSQPDLVLQIDTVIPLVGPIETWGIGQQLVPKDLRNDVYILIEGEITNHGSVQSVAEGWNIRFKGPDGQVTTAELLKPPNAPRIVINTESPESFVIYTSFYWPREMELGAIQPNGVSSGFVYGVFRGVSPGEFENPNASVVLSFVDASGKRSSATKFYQ